MESLHALLGTHPRISGGIFVGVLLAAILAVAARSGREARDPVRVFDSQQRHDGFARAGHQCEMTTLWVLRCQRGAEHADHFYPWARGGATSMLNLVAACSRHNTSKGAKMPTWWERREITRRRRSYFPPDTDRRPGQWYRG